MAAAIRPSLDKHHLRDRIYAYVKDQGSKLKTTAQALSASFEMSTNVCCKAIGQSKPFAGRCPSVLYHPPAFVTFDINVVNSIDCFAHAINGACNKFLIKAKIVQGGHVESALKKLR